MKKSLVGVLVLIIALAVAGCGGSSMGVATVTPEKAVDDYYGDLIKENYDQAVGRLSPMVFEALGMTREEYGSKVKEEHFIQSVKLTEYKISETKDIDADHKSFKVLYKSTVNGQPTSGTEEILAVKENGTWKINSLLITKLSKMTTNPTWNMGGGKLILSDIAVGDRPDGKFLKFYIENKTNQTVQLGFAGPWSLQVITDKGAYAENGPAGLKILPGKRQIITGVIKGAQGTISKATLKGVNLLNDKNVPSDMQSHSLDFEWK